MKSILQGLLVVALIYMGVNSAWCQKGDKNIQGQYKRPSINQRLFGNELSMVDNERDDYASNLAAYAVKLVREERGDQKSLDFARKIIGLGLHLSPRNKVCLVANAQLERGVMPQALEADYAPEVFASLLLARGLLLEKKEQKINQILARYFIDLSAAIDPRNEDAVYEAELKRLDHGDLSWQLLTEAKISE